MADPFPLPLPEYEIHAQQFGHNDVDYHHRPASFPSSGFCHNRNCNSLSSGFQKQLPWIMCISLVKIQASLYPNSDYLTNSELFRKEFDMYFPIFILVFYIKYGLLHLIRHLTIVGFPLTLHQFHICKYRFKR